MSLYLRELKDKQVVTKYARDIKEDLWDRALFNHSNLGLLAAAIHAFMYVFVLSSSINGLCHHRGDKNFANSATSIRLLALTTGGEGLHNNHHGFPRSPKFSVRQGRKLELDPAWPVIWLLARPHLARPYKTIEQAELQPQEG